MRNEHLSRLPTLKICMTHYKAVDFSGHVRGLIMVVSSELFSHSQRLISFTLSACSPLYPTAHVFEFTLGLRVALFTSIEFSIASYATTQVVHRGDKLCGFAQRAKTSIEFGSALKRLMCSISLHELPFH